MAYSYQAAIDCLMQEGTPKSVTEALLICLSTTKNKDGKFAPIRLSEDLLEHFWLAEQIVNRLLGGKNESV